MNEAQRKADKMRATGRMVCPVIGCYGIMKVSDVHVALAECLVCGITARKENVLFLRSFTKRQAEAGMAAVR